MPSSWVRRERKRINKILNNKENIDFSELPIFALISLLYQIYLYYRKYKNKNVLTDMQHDRFKALACILRNLIDMQYAIMNIGHVPTQVDLINIYNQYNVVNLELRPDDIHIDEGIWLTVEELNHLPPLPPLDPPPILYQVPNFVIQVIPPNL